jgi:FkbM family methyltransferase
MWTKESSMLNFGNVTRKVSAAYRVFNAEGVLGVTTRLRGRFDVHMRMRAARKVASVTLDGCIVNMKRIPSSKTKLYLADENYEVAERRLVPKYLDPELPVVELAGCIGVIACITNRMLKNPRLHVVVEANPFALPFLTETRDNNQCEFEIISEALAYGVPSITFRPTLDLLANSVQEKDEGKKFVTVSAITLRGLVTKRNFDSFNLICDIEGSEWDLVFNEGDVLQMAAIIVLETHARLIGEAKTAQLLAKLEDLGFRVVDQEDAVIVLRNLMVTKSGASANAATLA